MEFINIENLSRIYRKGENEIRALDNVSCRVKKGSILGIVGKSGSGKSTLLNLVGGLDRPSSGEIRIDGEDLAAKNRYQLALHRRNKVGMIFQSFNLIPNRNATENVLLPLVFSGIPRRNRKSMAEALLVQVGLEGRTGHLPSELSGGEAQRVAIARALANNPEIILADEPTGNLDSSTSEEIISLLIDLNKERGLTILMVTHDRETAENVCHNMITLKDGGIV